MQVSISPATQNEERRYIGFQHLRFFRRSRKKRAHEKECEDEYHRGMMSSLICNPPRNAGNAATACDRIGMAGSVARGETANSSDLDALVDRENPPFDRYMDLKFEIGAQVGVPVELVMRETVKERPRPVIERESAQCLAYSFAVLDEVSAAAPTGSQGALPER